jgi:signal transduction histidine kinase
LINGFPQQLAQVFMNLLVNASHAIQEKGLIQLKSRLEGTRVVVRVSDNGSGIATANLAKIFDPFFTTKAPGKGTGLGMSIAREIIQKHGGTIEVESEVGKGTLFTVSLPVGDLLAAP